MDVFGLVVFLTGAAVFARAWLGFRSVPDFQRAPGGPVMAAVEYADGFVPFQWAGATLMVCGLVVFAVAWWSERRRADPPTAP